MAIGLYQKMQPGEWYIDTPDKTLRLHFATGEDAREAKAFMEQIFQAGKQEGFREASNSLIELKGQLNSHIEECERFAAFLRQ